MSGGAVIAIAAALATGAQIPAPRLLDLRVDGGPTPFAGDGRLPATVSPNGDGPQHRREGSSDAGAKIAGMTEEARCERTANLLTARLDALARTADCLPHPDVERLVRLASVATVRAVALRLIDVERAESIWDDALSRHPALRDVDARLPGALAA